MQDFRYCSRLFQGHEKGVVRKAKSLEDAQRTCGGYFLIHRFFYRNFANLSLMAFDKDYGLRGTARIVQKPQPTENRAKKAANRPLLIPRTVFENGELWEFN
jgi:hypothetical protein